MFPNNFTHYPSFNMFVKPPPPINTKLIDNNLASFTQYAPPQQLQQLPPQSFHPAMHPHFFQPFYYPHPPVMHMQHPIMHMQPPVMHMHPPVMNMHPYSISCESDITNSQTDRLIENITSTTEISISSRHTNGKSHDTKKNRERSREKSREKSKKHSHSKSHSRSSSNDRYEKHSSSKKHNKRTERSSRRSETRKNDDNGETSERIIEEFDIIKLDVKQEHLNTDNRKKEIKLLELIDYLAGKIKKMIDDIYKEESWNIAVKQIIQRIKRHITTYKIKFGEKTLDRSVFSEYKNDFPFIYSHKSMGEDMKYLSILFSRILTGYLWGQLIDEIGGLKHETAVYHTAKMINYKNPKIKEIIDDVASRIKKFC